jgi:hypothetical protein
MNSEVGASFMLVAGGVTSRFVGDDPDVLRNEVFTRGKRRLGPEFGNLVTTRTLGSGEEVFRVIPYWAGIVAIYTYGIALPATVRRIFDFVRGDMELRACLETTYKLGGREAITPLLYEVRSKISRPTR